MNEPDLNLLIALDALITERSVAGAARRLGLSTSAMSRTLGRLREATGDPLLVRAGRLMVLTPRAGAIRERARYAANEARTLLRPAQTELNIASLTETFTLRVSDGFIEAFGPALIAEVATQAPGVLLRFTPKPEKSDLPLREGRVDLEIGVAGKSMGPEIRLQGLFRDRFVGVVREGHPLAGAKRVTLEEYIAWGHVVASRRGLMHGPVDEGLAQAGVSRKIATVVPGFPVALAVARATDLVALVPASILLSPSAREGMVHFELPVKTRTITISQLWHPRLEVDPAHRWLRGVVLQVCRRLMP
ncbi:LysR family transcriptional regulator [Pseudenterobacter timonensis]|uniref:LysR family transcriptional regulator n=1 Tax=Pseudenterobacter timonensis TaxID=1755099 RepID=UPI00077B774A|nr:LysR family transcriptional regulator [Pseudenterobacter timonensis]